MGTESIRDNMSQEIRVPSLPEIHDEIRGKERLRRKVREIEETCILIGIGAGAVSFITHDPGLLIISGVSFLAVPVGLYLDTRLSTKIAYLKAVANGKISPQ